MGTLIIFFPMLFFTVIAAFFKKEVFRAWSIYTLISSPVFALILHWILTEDYGDFGGGFGFIFLGLLSLIYIVFSVLVILVSYLFSKRRYVPSR